MSESLTSPDSKQNKPALSEAVVRLVEKRAAVIHDTVERLRFVRKSITRHEAAAARHVRYLQRSLALRKTLRQRRIFQLAALGALLILALALGPRALRQPAPEHTASLPSPAPYRAAVRDQPPKVWLVEEKGALETYSNGLHVSNEYFISTRPRAYRSFDQCSWRASAVRNQPAGIVFHTTESTLAPFDPSANARLKRNGRGLLEFARNRHLYHFVIDRFGRVFRLVAETDYANHAGFSVWADGRDIYWGLNQSFFGVAFEAQTAESDDSPAGEIATPAQIDSARLLTEALRSKYRIPSSDCVTHAQVSVNPQNLRLGYHTDWADNFPFREIGLSDNYEVPIAALTLFGFDFDTAFVRATGGHVWKGLIAAEEQLVRDAAAHGTTYEMYRHTLQRRYREWLATLPGVMPDETSGDRSPRG